MAFRDSNYCGTEHPDYPWETCELPPFHEETGQVKHAAEYTYLGRFWLLEWRGGKTREEREKEKEQNP
ncbi:MAG TPA: hypothetical protein VJG48_00415 [Candidatus Paceibacterota bacterium]